MPHEYRTKRRIEFSDTDMAGIVHFARFFVFMESAEHEFLRSLGTSVATEWEGNKIGWPRLAASCEYLKPVKFEEELEIHLTVARKGTKSPHLSICLYEGQRKRCSRSVGLGVLHLQPRRKIESYSDTRFYRRSDRSSRM